MSKKKKIKKIRVSKKKETKKLRLVSKKRTLSEKLNLKTETIHYIVAGILFFLSIFLLAASFSSAGPIGDFIYSKLKFLFGVGYYIIPVASIILAIAFLQDRKGDFTKTKLYGSGIFLFAALALTELIFEKGGFIGAQLAKTESFIGLGISIILFLILVAISQIIIFDGLPKLKFSKKEERDVDYSNNLSEKEIENISKSSFSRVKTNIFDKESKKEEDVEKKEEKKIFKISEREVRNTNKESDKMTEKIMSSVGISSDKKRLPPLSLLSKNSGKANAGDTRQNANIIKNTLASFGIGVEMEDVSVGPTVSRYSLRPDIGVKVSKIAALNDDLALALSAESLLIQTPIPGKSLVGIEMPNKNKTMVGAGSLFSEKKFINSEFALPLAIGEDIAGTPAIIGLERTPHMLIAGATGSGKSVTVHTILNSLLYKHGPDTLKLMLIDPKRVEMTLYNGIPHLLTPVITNPKNAILALRWAINEMERRYEVLEGHSLRDIDSYHKNIVASSVKKTDGSDPEKMPYIVIVIDELADIMQQYPKELEGGIVSIAQKARAIGIHMILSTQRPSVNIVTGLIKANVPTRLALQVSSVIDSRTILDQGGAEKLLGKGDMLYMTGSMSKPIRVQSPFIPENEVKAVVRSIKKIYKDYLEDTISLSPEAERAEEVVAIGNDINFDDEDFDQDDLLNDAKNEVMASGKASTSYLQRKLGIGYARAARIIDTLEEKGIIGPLNGSKPREVLVKNRNNIPEEETGEEGKF